MPHHSAMSDDNSHDSGGDGAEDGFASFQSAVILPFCDENKAGTKSNGDCQPRGRGRPLAAELGIERSWRDVVDFGDPKSSGIGDSWGYKRVSVPRVSLLDHDLSVDSDNRSAD